MLYFCISDETGLPFVIEDTPIGVSEATPSRDARIMMRTAARTGVGVIAGEWDLLSIVVVLLFAPLYFHEFD